MSTAGIVSRKLTGQIEPFDSFWEGPEDIEKGYHTFYLYYRANYLQYLPENKRARILVISCGPGYFLNFLRKHGYSQALGIDSDATKVELARAKNLKCQQAQAFPFLEERENEFDLIFGEQEINHLTKDEILAFLNLCFQALRPGGCLIVHSLNGANPITGAEALAQNFDHYNTLTEYSLRQILRCARFADLRVIPLKLYVFYKNPLNYVLWAMDRIYTAFFRLSFILYGKFNRIFTKKIAAICRKPGP